MTTYIYRIEHEINQHGPYRFEDSQNSMIYAALRYTFSDIDTHPPLWADCKMLTSHAGMDHYCGFDSIEKLFQWFERARYTLALEGYIICVYACPDHLISHGTYQDAFIKDESMLVDFINILEAYEMM